MFSLFSNKPSIERSEEEQAVVDAETARLTLYHFESCPYCARVRDTIAQLALKIEKRDIRLDPQHREVLVAGGGKGQVPALRIEHDNDQVEWMYESSDINAYLKEKFG